MSTKEFREQRKVKHIIRVLCSHYLIGQNLIRAVRIFPQKRHLQLRFISTSLQCPFGKKSVIGVVIVTYLLNDREFFEEKHILQAIKKFYPQIQIVKGSYYHYQNSREGILKSYLELEKNDGSEISLKELLQSKYLFVSELKNSVEKMAPSMLMIHNEEEVLKNILLLSNELSEINDIPQVMITFESQTNEDLIFKVIFVRIRKNQKTLNDLLPKSKGNIKGIVKRLQVVGHLYKKYPKEAAVIHIHIPKEHSILRSDASFNLYSAREKVVIYLEKKFGNIRDYNGGLLVKQNKQLSEIKEHFKTINHSKLDLLEEFFYSITPIENQFILPFNYLISLFSFFLKSLDITFSKMEDYFYKVHEENQTLFIIIRAGEFSIENYLKNFLRLSEIDTEAIVSTRIKIDNTVCVGFIYPFLDQSDRQKFIRSLELGIQKWYEKIQSQQTLRLNFLHLPKSLDPRLSGEQFSSIIFKMLYEGLMRFDKEGKPTCAIAKSVLISEDFKKYTFKLRKCFWSNGDQILAKDFEYSWKKILDSNFKTPFAFLFYIIKNAKGAKEGIIPLKEVGIKAVNKGTLTVELEYPAPYFLELTAHAFYSPVNHKIDQMHPNWPTFEDKSYVCNGPFCLNKAQPNQDYEFIKNKKYWDQEVVKLNKISISKTNSFTAFEMFKNEEIDWLGRPIRPWEPFFSDKIQDQVISRRTPDVVYWCVLNTERFPFCHQKIRKALCLALNRKEILQSLGDYFLPASTPLPLVISQLDNEATTEEDKEKAQSLFAEALKELGLIKENLPIFTFLHTTRRTRTTTAEKIIAQWKEVLGIECRLEGCEWALLFSKLTQGDYQIGEMGWYSPISDPFYTLEAFKERKNIINQQLPLKRFLNIRTRRWLKRLFLGHSTPF